MKHKGVSALNTDCHHLYTQETSVNDGAISVYLGLDLRVFISGFLAIGIQNITAFPLLNSLWIY